MRGKLITLEGLDYSGKSVQMELLRDYLKGKGSEVVLLREPGGTEISEKIRDVLLDKGHHRMAPATEVLLYSAARAQIVAEAIRPALDAGKVVICDRFYDSTTVYQGYGRGISLKLIEELHKFVTCDITPDLTILLDIDPVTAQKRRPQRAGGPDRLEVEEGEFHQRVRQGYQDLVRKEPGRFVVLNGEETIEQVHKKILQQIQKRLHL